MKMPLAPDEKWARRLFRVLRDKPDGLILHLDPSTNELQVVDRATRSSIGWSDETEFAVGICGYEAIFDVEDKDGL